MNPGKYYISGREIWDKFLKHDIRFLKFDGRGGVSIDAQPIDWQGEETSQTAPRPSTLLVLREPQTEEQSRAEERLSSRYQLVRLNPSPPIPKAGTICASVLIMVAILALFFISSVTPTAMPEQTRVTQLVPLVPPPKPEDPESLEDRKTEERNTSEPELASQEPPEADETPELESEKNELFKAFEPPKNKPVAAESEERAEVENRQLTAQSGPKANAQEVKQELVPGSPSFGSNPDSPAKDVSKQEESRAASTRPSVQSEPETKPSQITGQEADQGYLPMGGPELDSSRNDALSQHKLIDGPPSDSGLPVDVSKLAGLAPPMKKEKSDFAKPVPIPFGLAATKPDLPPAKVTVELKTDTADKETENITIHFVFFNETERSSFYRWVGFSPEGKDAKFLILEHEENQWKATPATSRGWSAEIYELPRRPGYPYADYPNLIVGLQLRSDLVRKLESRAKNLNNTNKSLRALRVLVYYNRIILDSVLSSDGHELKLNELVTQG